MKEDISKLSENIEKAVNLVRILRMENEKLKKERQFLNDQINVMGSENKVSAKVFKDVEKMKLERIKIRDKVGVLLNSMQDIV
ncbi:MAG: hypothetical protein ABIJ15_08200 [bacterium]